MLSQNNTSLGQGLLWLCLQMHWREMSIFGFPGSAAGHQDRGQKDSFEGHPGIKGTKIDQLYIRDRVFAYFDEEVVALMICKKPMAQDAGYHSWVSGQQQAVCTGFLSRSPCRPAISHVLDPIIMMTIHLIHFLSESFHTA